jgi:hypothetical protein
MALRLIAPADSVTRLMADRLAGYASGQGFRTRAMAAAKPASLAMAAPHPVFQLALDDIGPPGAAERAVMSGWRYLLTTGGQVVAAAFASASGPKARASFSHVNEGPQVRSSQQALALAEAWPEIREGRYALGLLRVPALYLEALWLRDEDGKDGGDRFVPLDPAPAPLKAMQRVDAAKFEAALATLKAARAKTTGASN